jgi:hypothetical protein
LKLYYFSNEIGDVQLDQNMAMEDMWRALNMLQQENNMRRTFEQLQAGALPALQKFRIPEMLSISNHRFVNITNITIGLKL